MEEKHPGLEAIQELLQSPQPVKWLFTGDSITHGALHTMGHRDYPEHFRERVRWELRRMQDCVINNACSGWTVKVAGENLDSNVLQFKPDVVFLNFAPNDCVGGAAGLNNFKSNYLEVIDRIQNETSALVVLQTPSLLISLDEVRFAELPAYIQVVRNIADERQLLLIDHSSAWEEENAKGTMMYWLSDAVHPNEYGHLAMAHTLFRSL